MACLQRERNASLHPLNQVWLPSYFSLQHHPWIKTLGSREYKKWSPIEEALDRCPCQHHGKCIENSTENIYSDVGVKKGYLRRTVRSSNKTGTYFYYSPENLWSKEWECFSKKSALNCLISFPSRRVFNSRSITIATGSFMCFDSETGKGKTVNYY